MFHPRKILAVALATGLLFGAVSASAATSSPFLKVTTAKHVAANYIVRAYCPEGACTAHTAGSCARLNRRAASCVGVWIEADGRVCTDEIRVGLVLSDRRRGAFTPLPRRHGPINCTAQSTATVV